VYWTVKASLGIGSSCSQDAMAKDKGLIMTMGKGGVRKTIVAASIATLLAQRGHKVLLTTTDPAAHVNDIINQLQF